MKITIPLLAIVLATMTVPLSSYAQAEKHERCQRHATGAHASSKFRHEAFGMRGVPPHLAALNLSEAQQDKIFELMHAQMPKARQADKQRHQLMGELNKLSNAVSYDEIKVKQISDRLAAIEKETLLNRAAKDHEIYQILTPEQRKQLDAVKLSHEEGFGKSRFEKHHSHTKKSEITL